MKVKEWDARCKTRSEELLAIADTIKILNDDDALDLFKKAIPSASFLQVMVTDKEVRHEAIKALSSSQRKGKSLNLQLIVMALHGKKVSFDKVVKMIDDMVVLLGKEQEADETKKEYCEAEFDKADDKKKGLERTISDLEKLIAEDEEMVTTLTQEIKDLEEGIVKLDREVAAATEQRKSEHEEFVTTLAANQAAMGLMEMAKNRMNKFYNPKLYKAPPTTAPPTLFLQQDQSAVQKKQESSGVIAMMDTLKGDLAKEIQEMEFNEKDAQEEYELMVTDAAEKRTLDTKSIEEKTAVKAGLEDEIVKNGDAKD